MKRLLTTTLKGILSDVYLGLARKIGALLFVIYIALNFEISTFAQDTNWWKLDDQTFAQRFAVIGTNSNTALQSKMAWMLFARLNQPQKQADGLSYSTWELWPSDKDTFNPTSKLFAIGKSVRKHPSLQPAFRLGQKRFGLLRPMDLHGPIPADDEEVTRNSISYNYLIGRTLTTSIGVSNYLANGHEVDFPIGAVEIKAKWGISTGSTFSGYPTNGAYQISDSSGTVYSLLGLHIMAKLNVRPQSPFSSPEPSWFWTTFELKSNPGLKNAQSLLTVKDDLARVDSLDLLSESGLGETLFTNYVCNGTQLAFVDDQNKPILLGNTILEVFEFTPSSASDPSQWKTWRISCHTCHGTAGANISLPTSDNNFFFPFKTANIGEINLSKMQGYQSMDFNWAIPSFAN
jgi:hypothetical protein